MNSNLILQDTSQVPRAPNGQFILRESWPRTVCTWKKSLKTLWGLRDANCNSRPLLALLACLCRGTRRG